MGVWFKVCFQNKLDNASHQIEYVSQYEVSIYLLSNPRVRRFKMSSSGQIRIRSWINFTPT
ncbi:MAG: hypothetical protein ACP5I6_06950 [Caldisphaera sp.]